MMMEFFLNGLIVCKAYVGALTVNNLTFSLNSACLRDGKICYLYSTTSVEFDSSALCSEYAIIKNELKILILIQFGCAFTRMDPG